MTLEGTLQLVRAGIGLTILSHKPKCTGRSLVWPWPYLLLGKPICKSHIGMCIIMLACTDYEYSLNCNTQCNSEIIVIWIPLMLYHFKRTGPGSVMCEDVKTYKKFNIQPPLEYLPPIQNTGNSQIITSQCYISGTYAWKFTSFNQSMKSHDIGVDHFSHYCLLLQKVFNFLRLCVLLYGLYSHRNASIVCTQISFVYYSKLTCERVTVYMRAYMLDTIIPSPIGSRWSTADWDKNKVSWCRAFKESKSGPVLVSA